MKISPFLMESWLSGYRFKVKYNLAESGMRDLTLGDFLFRCGQNAHCLDDLLMEDMPTIGSEYLREEISSCYRSINSDNVLVVTGTGEALFVFFNNILDAGDEVVVSFPAFQALYEVPKAIGAKIVPYEHKIEEGFRFDAERFCSLITDKTKLVVLNNPHNPTGAECDPDTMKAIVEKARKHGSKVLFDEHYRFLPHDDREIIESGIELGDDLFATGSITKCFGLMGLRIGWLVGDKNMLYKCRDYRDYLTHTMSPISEKLTSLALKNRKKITGESREILSENKELLGNWMQDHEEFFDYVPPESGVVCFPKYKMNIPSQTLAKNLIENCGVFCLPAHSFEMENHLRIGLGPKPQLFKQALERIGEYLRK